MNDQLPDFEPEATSEPLAQPPKKRRKPMRRKAAEITTAPKRRKMLRTVKANGIRRGRPKGSINKPKVPVEKLGPSPIVAGQAQAVLVVLEVLARYSSEVRKEILNRALVLA